MKKIFSIFLFLFISLFINTQIVNSLEENLISNEKVQLEKTEDNKVSDDSLKSNPVKDDIFGDEQTFPFVAGLGKNAAH
tara:strand:+ start:336 stop:572 length:237 start_codon:yes stop_codon:yes gene_type:complete